MEIVGMEQNLDAHYYLIKIVKEFQTFSVAVVVSTFYPIQTLLLSQYKWFLAPTGAQEMIIFVRPWVQS